MYSPLRDFGAGTGPAPVGVAAAVLPGAGAGGAEFVAAEAAGTCRVVLHFGQRTIWPAIWSGAAIGVEQDGHLMLIGMTGHPRETSAHRKRYKGFSRIIADVRPVKKAR